ncbi:hypothetical protein PG994_012817 [Apiospora phragmitis]|uniref:Uncharacterized protein n=1 Tax=Apiospora phragmitis TaxID=2905665 RepID=A0ABR1T923_9PEZI
MHGEAETERTTLILISVVKIHARFRSSSGPVDNNELVSRLKQAWAAMRDGHPGLAVECGPQFSTYRVPSPEDMEAWLDSTFHDGRSGSHYAPLLHTDARNTWVFWDVFLAKVADGARPAVPVPATGEKGGLPPSSPPPVTGDSKDWPAGPVDYVRLFISERQTAAVVAACKARGISVAATLYAALASAARAIQKTDEGSKGKGKYAVSFHHFDVWPWLQAKATNNLGPTGASAAGQLPPSPPNYGGGLGTDYHVVVPFALDMMAVPPGGAPTGPGVVVPHQERSLDELAQEMNGFFRSTRRDFGQDPAGLDA